jgi:hypothetical protein
MSLLFVIYQLFEFRNLVFMVKQRYSHLNKRLSKWRNGTVSRPISLMKQNERRMRSDKAANQVNITHLFVSSVGNIEGI